MSPVARVAFSITGALLLALGFAWLARSLYTVRPAALPQKDASIRAYTYRAQAVYSAGMTLLARPNAPGIAAIAALLEGSCVQRLAVKQLEAPERPLDNPWPSLPAGLGLRRCQVLPTANMDFVVRLTTQDQQTITYP